MWSFNKREIERKTERGRGRRGEVVGGKAEWQRPASSEEWRQGRERAGVGRACPCAQLELLAISTGVTVPGFKAQGQGVSGE